MDDRSQEMKTKLDQVGKEIDEAEADADAALPKPPKETFAEPSEGAENPVPPVG
jgi:hypothetical protein